MAKGVDFRSSRWFLPLFLYVALALPASLVLLFDEPFGRAAKILAVVLLFGSTGVLLGAFRKRMSGTPGRHTGPPRG